MLTKTKPTKPAKSAKIALQAVVPALKSVVQKAFTTPAREEIAGLAYTFWIRSGRAHRNDLELWFTAEILLTAELASSDV